jgi:hypothetical protein
MNSFVNRREFLSRLAAAPIVTGLGIGARQRGARPAMTVYKSPSCGCCGDWVDHVKDAGFKVTVRDIADVDPIKRDLGVPANLGSCHTAVVGPYVLEGHVPADLVDKLLADKPAGARGLAVPGMPIGSPGMEVPGRPADKYDVILFNNDGRTRVFARR